MPRTTTAVPTIHPDTGQEETHFRERVREALGLDWSVRDETIFTELRRLKKIEENEDVS